MVAHEAQQVYQGKTIRDHERHGENATYRISVHHIEVDFGYLRAEASCQEQCIQGLRLYCGRHHVIIGYLQPRSRRGVMGSYGSAVDYLKWEQTE